MFLCLQLTQVFKACTGIGQLKRLSFRKRYFTSARSNQKSCRKSEPNVIKFAVKDFKTQCEFASG